MVTIAPFTPIGFIVLGVFITGLLMIIFEVQLAMDKFKPALMMMSTVAIIGIYYWFSGDDPERFKPLIAMQAATKESLFGLIAFMAFMWMIVEILNERNVFNAMNQALINMGLNGRGLFWIMGLLSALLSPFISSLTTTMIFGKSISNISKNSDYTHLVLCNTIISSNSGVWFIGTSTSLMVILAGKVHMTDLLMLFPAAIFGWILSALVLDRFYLTKLDLNSVLKTNSAEEKLKDGGLSLTFVCAFAIISAVILNMVLHVDIEFALGSGLGIVVMYIWLLRQHWCGIEINLDVQLQKVEWSTLMYYIGIITGMAALNHVGWLSYVRQLYEYLPATWVNFILGMVSSCIDNNLLEAAAIMANPPLGVDQWMLNALMVGIGGSLTVVGSSAGVMAMSIDKSYTFGVHLRFLPAVLANFLGSFGLWYLQFEVLHWV
ncbi:MAG: SLC13 family permease [Methylococcaceae bacterium]